MANESSSGRGTPPPDRKDNSFALGLGLALGAVSGVLLSALGGNALPLALLSEFILPIPVCLRARSNVLALALVPNAVLNSWIVLIQAPRSAYWAGWRNEWGDSLILLGFGGVASLVVSGLFMWRRKAKQLT